MKLIIGLLVADSCVSLPPHAGLEVMDQSTPSDTTNTCIMIHDHMCLQAQDACHSYLKGIIATCYALEI